MRRQQFGRYDYAVASYHMGPGNMGHMLESETAMRPWPQIVLEPDTNQKTRLSKLADRSWAYWFEVKSASTLIARWRKDRPAVETAMASAPITTDWRAVQANRWYGKDTGKWEVWSDLQAGIASGELAPIPPTPTVSFGLSYAEGVAGSQLGPGGEVEVFRTLSPAATGLAITLASEVRARTDPGTTLTLGDMVMSRAYQERRAISQGNTFAFCSGNAFEIMAPGRDSPTQTALNSVLWELRRSGDVAWWVSSNGDDDRYIVCLNPAASQKYMAVWIQARNRWVGDLDAAGIDVYDSLSGRRSWLPPLIITLVWVGVAVPMLMLLERNQAQRRRRVDPWFSRAVICLWPLVLAVGALTIAVSVMLAIGCWATDTELPQWFRKFYGIKRRQRRRPASGWAGAPIRH